MVTDLGLRGAQYVALKTYRKSVADKERHRSEMQRETDVDLIQETPAMPAIVTPVVGISYVLPVVTFIVGAALSALLIRSRTRN